MIGGLWMQAARVAVLALALLAGAAPAAAGPWEDALEALVRRDYAAALAILQPLAEQGDALAQGQLGVMYAEGRGVAMDEREAARWYRLAAEQGVALAQFNLGNMYRTGSGVAKDDQEAVRWYRLAAEQGYADAQFNLGVAYANGHGVTKDEREAVRWYRLAAEQGLAEAQHNLGGMYFLGQGVTQDTVRAYMWFNLAAAQGREKAGELRELIAKEMTRAQIAEAQRLSSNWRPKASGEAAAPQLPQDASVRTDPALVAEAQRLLGRLGYDAGPADGVAGRRTQAAVAAYQRASGLPEYGEIDGAFVERLRRDVAARAAPRAERQPAVAGSGSGFFVSAEGHVLSNAHVVQGCRRIMVQPPGEEASRASVMATSAADDLALLKPDAVALAAAQFRSGAPLRQGESVLAYGFPLAGALASSGNATVGHVTALAGLGDDARLMQISGNSSRGWRFSVFFA